MKKFKEFVNESVLNRLLGPTEIEQMEWIFHNYFKLDVIPEDVNDFIDYIFSDYETVVDTSAPGPIYNKLFSNKINTLLLSILIQRNELILNDNLETVLTKYYGLNMDEVNDIINNEIEKIDWGISYRRTNENLLDKMEGPDSLEVWKTLGYDRVFNNIEDYFNYLIKDIEPIDTVGGRRWYIGDEPIFREDVFNNLFVIKQKYYNLMLKMFFEDRNQMEIYFRDLLKKYPLWRKYKWITYGNID